MAPVGQMAMQCPQPMHPNAGVLLNVALLFSRQRLKSLQICTHKPQPVHLTESILMDAFSFVQDVGIAIIIIDYFVHTRAYPNVSISLISFVR
jgi:hypothetical protein